MPQTERELRIGRLIRGNGLDPSDVLLSRDNAVRGRETVSAKFRHQGRYVTISVVEGINSTDRATAMEITEQALQRGVRPPRPNGNPGASSEKNR